MYSNLVIMLSNIFWAQKRALVWFYSVIGVLYINAVPARGTVMVFCINWDTLGFNFNRGTVSNLPMGLTVVLLPNIFKFFLICLASQFSRRSGLLIALFAW